MQKTFKTHTKFFWQLNTIYVCFIIISEDGYVQICYLFETTSPA